MDKSQRDRRRRHRREDEPTFGWKEQHLDDEKRRGGQGDEAAQVEIDRRLEE
jgi:hypothetical protein